MKKILTLILLPLAFVVNAQKANVATGIKSDNGKLVVQVKFLFPDKIFPSTPVNVFRKLSPSGNWEKLSQTPIAKSPVVKDYSSGDESYRNYQGFMNRTASSDAMEENNALAIAGLLIITDNLFAKYAGCYYEDKSAVTGQTYQYRISDAGQADKELAISAPITVTSNYLPSVQGLIVKQKGKSILLNWEKNSRFYAYKLYKKAASGERISLTADPILLGKLNGEGVKDKSSEYKFTDTNVVNGTTVSYDITGVDVLGNESPASAPISVAIKDMTPPHMAANLKFSITKHDVALTWRASKDNDLLGYNIYRNSTSDTIYKKINTSVLSTSTLAYTDKELGEGATYGYRVQSVDAAGNTTFSRAVKAFFPDKTPPAKPVGLRAVAKPGIVELVWNKNKEADLRGYYIYRASNRNKDYFNMLYKEPIAENKFTDTLPGVAKNEFVYYVEAVDKQYNVSTPSDTVIAHLPDTMAPHAPIIKTIEYMDGSTKISWAQPDDDGIRFDIFCNTDSINSGTYKKINNAPVIVNNYSHKITTKGQPYYYYLVAYDNAGNTSVASQKRSIYIDADTVVHKGIESLNANVNMKDTLVTILWKGGNSDIRGNIVYRKAEDAERFSSVSSMLKQDEFIDRTVEYGKKYQYRIRSFFTSDDGFIDSKEVNVNVQ